MTDNVIKGPWPDDPQWEEIQNLVEEIHALSQKADRLKNGDPYDPKLAVIAGQMRQRSERIWDLYQEYFKQLGGP